MCAHSEKITNLDVGSGSTTNPFHKRFRSKNVVHIDVSRNAYCLEVNCDAHFLPFKNESFDIVHASYILEHLANPYLAIQEFRRVAKKIVIIKVPNASRFFNRESPGHIYSWNQHSLRNLLNLFFPRVEISFANRLTNPTLINRVKNLVYTTLFRFNELYAICYKEYYQFDHYR
jgi:ubiquinone/menaquinone biosynthesis C-methylase UbiE